MKKILSTLMVSSILFLVGCSSTQLAIIPEQKILKNSQFIDVNIEKIIEPQIFIKIKNKSKEIVEIYMKESNINNSPIYDGEHIMSVKSHNEGAAWNQLANGIGQLSMALGGGVQKTDNDTSTKKLELRTENILLNPDDEVKKSIGYGFEVSYPVKIILKVKQNGNTEYVSLILEKTNKTVEVNKYTYENIIK